MTILEINKWQRLWVVVIVQTLVFLISIVISNYKINFYFHTIFVLLFVLYSFYIPYIKEENMYAVPGLTAHGIFNKILRILYVIFGAVFISLSIVINPQNV